MPNAVITFLLWAYVLILGICCGAGLYESRIEVPRWLRPGPGGHLVWDREAAAASDAGLRFWVFVSTGPLTLLTLAGLAAAWSAPSPARGWWLAALAATLLDRGMTFGYFIPTMVKLVAGSAYAPAEAAAKALEWTRLGWIRHAANAFAWLAALRALTLWHARL
jgi:hypothetical protein